MIIKVNFAPENSTAPEGFLVDSGAGYNTDQGYGWVTQDSLDNDNPNPIDLNANTRDRTGDNGTISDTLIHLQYPTDLVSPLAESSIKVPSAWEYDIANGFYFVTVGVGDPEYTDSNHVVNVEGQSIISGFIPTEGELFTEATALVEVTDGQLTIDAVGGDNTKLTFVEITPEGESDDTDSGDEITEDSGDTDTGGDDVTSDEVTGDSEDIVRINFGTATTSAPDGYIQDIGGEYNDGQGYGWITQESIGSDSPTPINLSPNTRDRNLIQEDTFDSLIHLQYGDSFENENAVRTPAAWEYELANGEYTVTVAVGDPQFTDSNHVINIEGNTVISGFTPTAEQLFTVETAVVEVTDGKLTIDALGGSNTKLNFVEITPGNTLDDNETPITVTPIEEPTDVPIPIEGGGLVSTVEPVAGGVNVNFGTATVDNPNGFIQDIGAGYSVERGYGWVTQDSSGTENPTSIDLFANTRDRNTLFNDGQGGVFQEPVKDSLIHMQYPTGLGNSDSSVTTPAAWEYDLANGQYQVTVGVGDPDFFDSNHVINVEGETIIDGFVPTGSVENGFLPLGEQAFTTGTATVEVTDGRLTIDAIGGENTKINYVTIVPVEDI